ncbi:MAG: hypothetical protein ACPGSO_00680 [Vicingaceae bacterium]
MKTEAQLQSKIVLDYSQNRPEEKGTLFSVANRTLSVRDGQKQKAMGLVKGVSDLIYFKGNRLVCLEIKLPGQKHKRSHIEDQLSWGEKMISEGAEYYIITSLSAFWTVINELPFKDGGIWDCEKIKQKLKESKSTIVFQ